MNKTQFIDAVALESGLSKLDARKAFDAFVKTIREQLKQDDKIALLGFGNFSVIEKAAHLARNPRTGIKIEVEKRKVVKFKAGSELSEAVQ